MTRQKNKDRGTKAKEQRQGNKGKMNKGKGAKGR